MDYLTGLDFDAVQAAMAALQRNGGKGSVPTAAVVRTYRRAECRPFKDAPKDGEWVEAWHRYDGVWYTVSFGRTKVWASGDKVYGDGKWFSHYRLPFDPTEAAT